MKRSETLAPLSRDHHGSLILAQLLKKNAPAYKGLPETILGKCVYALQHYEQEMTAHFEREEQMLALLSGINPEIDALAAEIRMEHSQLREMIAALETKQSLAGELDALGRLLEKHIRTEERVLFPLIEQHCPEPLTKELHALLH